MFRRLLATLALASAVAMPAHAVIVYQPNAGNLTLIPGLTGFSTTGSMMSGMEVTACFVNGPCETEVWTSGGGNLGGVSGTGWGLSVDGDTFTANWNFTIDTGTGQLLSLLLDGRDGLTIFDRTEPSDGTPGSAQGRDWTTTLNGDTLIHVTYLDPTTLGGPAVGDIFQQVFIEFQNQTGPRVDFSFQQDTDNDSRFFDVPEPSSLLLLGLGVLALSLTRRRSM